MKYGIFVVSCLAIAACSSGGGSSGFCADSQAFASKAAPCFGGSDGGSTAADAGPSCDSIYNGSQCTAADRTRLDAIGSCVNGLANCDPNNETAFFTAEVNCTQPDIDAGLAFGGVSASCNAAFGASF